MKKIVRLTESDLVRIVKQVISEQNSATYTGSKEGDIEMFVDDWKANKKFGVMAIQNQLGIKADGIKGPQTTACMRRFQKEAGLTPDGLVGPKTAEALWVNSRHTSPNDYLTRLSKNDSKWFSYCTSRKPINPPKL